MMGEPDVIDSVIASCRKNNKVPSIETLNSEMPLREYRKDGGRRLLKTLFNRLRLRKAASANISEPDPTFKVAYLGNVVTGWAKGNLFDDKVDNAFLLANNKHKHYINTLFNVM